jgi:integrase
MNKKELKKAFDEKLISEEKFKEELFRLETELKTKKKASRIYESLNDEEFVKLLEATDKEHHKVAFILAYGAGLRVEEITGGTDEEGVIHEKLQAEDISFKENKIHVRQGKGGKDRMTIIPKWLKVKHLELLPIKCGARSLEAVFKRNSYKAGINRIIGYFTRKGKQVAINRFHFHCLRHSFATNLLRDGVPVNHVQTLMGHKNLATTSRYTQVNAIDAIQMAMDKRR